MKVAIEVETREQAGMVKTAMADCTVRAFVLVSGALLSLPSDRARRRVLALIQDRLDEEATGGRPDA